MEMGRKEVQAIIDASLSTSLSMTFIASENDLTDSSLTQAVQELKEDCSTKSCSHCHYVNIYIFFTFVTLHLVNELFSQHVYDLWVLALQNTWYCWFGVGMSTS